MPPRLTEVGARERPDHYYLPREARCFFWGEYTPYEHTDGKKWDFSATNQLLSNFKKKMERKGQPDWKYKVAATQRIAEAFSGFWKWANLHEQHHVTLVPVPPSKARGATGYDPRMLEVLDGIAASTGIALDVRDCLSFSGRHAASHESTDRPSPDDLFQELRFDAVVGQPRRQPGVIFLFDDMLMTGAHYVAVSRILAQHFTGVEIIGNFVARRIVPDPFADLDDF